MLHFHFDDCVGVVPKKVILRPEIPSVGETCVVKWSDGKDYEATVKAVGKDCTRRGGGRYYCLCVVTPDAGNSLIFVVIALFTCLHHR